MIDQSRLWDAQAAAEYDTPGHGMFAPEVLGPTVEVLAELDLMAQLAGFTRESRWADWDRSDFTADSRSHVTVYRLPGGAP